MQNILHETTVRKLHEAYKSGKLTCEAAVDYYLKRINSLEEKLNAVILINPNAKQQAIELDNYYKEHGFKGVLHGVPVLVKDNIETCDMPTTAGSESLRGFETKKDAPIVKKLKEAGAIVIAKTNLHEFAIWGQSISSIKGQTVNPYHFGKTPGGSSGGTGAGLAANYAILGIGTDTINSVRNPASANSIVGFRPTMGLISDEGIVPYSNTQDTAGPMARTVEDCAIMLDVMAQDDKKGEKPYVSNLCMLKEGECRIGVVESLFGSKEEHKQVSKIVYDFIEKTEKKGIVYKFLNEDIDSDNLVSNISVHLYELNDHLTEYLQNSEAKPPYSSLKEIYDSGKIHEGIVENTEKALTLSTKSDDYKHRLRLRDYFIEEINAIFKTYKLDALIFPQQQELVCDIGKVQAKRNGAVASVTGLPSICIPAGFSESTEQAPLGVPVGLELLGTAFSEDKLLQIAYTLEQMSTERLAPKL